MKIPFFQKKQTAEEKLKETLGKYQKSLEQNPNDLRIRVKIAELYLEYNKKNKAIEEYLLAARAYQGKRLFQIAVAIYNHAISIDQEQVDVYTELANLHLKNGFVGDGVAVLEKLANHYYGKEMVYEAAQVLEKIKEIDPDNEFFKIKIARFYQNKAISEEATLKTGPKDKWNLVPEQVKKKEPAGDTAPGDFFDLASALSQDDEVTFSISTVTRGEENGSLELSDVSVAPDEIFRQLKTIMESAPDQDSPLFHYNLGLAYQRCNQLEEAMDEFTSSLNGCENKAECYLRLIDCCMALKRLDESQDMIGSALKLPALKQQEKLELIYRSGLIYKAQGEKAKALKVFKKIYDIDNTFKSVGVEIKKLTP